MEDINSPPHAALVKGAHWDYEAWVRDNMRNDYFVSNAPASTSQFYEHHHLPRHQHQFCHTHQQWASACIYNHSVSGTRECLIRAQRGAAGLLYRFLIDTGRNN